MTNIDALEGEQETATMGMENLWGQYNTKPRIETGALTWQSVQELQEVSK